MYQVIKMYGDVEPWWFLDGWEDDVISRAAFARYEDALTAFQKELSRLSERFPKKKTKNGTMAAFWDENDQHWCEECDDYLQRYHSLMLVETKSHRSKQALLPKIRPCKIKQEKYAN